jgi:hypothetical protein
MKSVILIIHIQGFWKDHSIVDNKLGRPMKGTSHSTLKVEHVIMGEESSNTKKGMDTSCNSLLSSIMHLISQQHLI